MPRSLRASHDEIVTRAVRLLQAWIARDHHLYELASILGVSYGFLEGIFRTTVGVDLTTYRTFIRLHHARRLLACTALPIVEVGRLSGFRHQSHFGKVFRDDSGMTPSEYRVLVALQAERGTCPARTAAGCLLSRLAPEGRPAVRLRRDHGCGAELHASARRLVALPPVAEADGSGAVEVEAAVAAGRMPARSPRP